MVLNSENIRDIHKQLFKMTISVPRMYLFMEKVSNRSVKTINRKQTQDSNASLLLLLFMQSHYNTKVRKLINHELMEKAEEEKDETVKQYINNSRDVGKWIYLASSHADSAKDHAPYQGKLYYDDKAPDEIQNYAKKHGYKSIQWVMSGPVWFITRPNCRHFFKSLPLDVVKQYSVKELQRRYKTHRLVGDKSLSTPVKVVIEEYVDRLHMLKAMNSEYSTERLRREILKTELLIKKWKNIL